MAATRKLTRQGIGAVGSRTTSGPSHPVTCPAPRQSSWRQEAGSGARKRPPLDLLEEWATPRPLTQDLTGLDLTPREAFIFWFVDGQHDLEAIADAIGATHGEIAAVIERLVALGLVGPGSSR